MDIFQKLWLYFLVMRFLMASCKVNEVPDVTSCIPKEKVQTKLLHDLASASVGKKNFIYLELEVNLPCTYRSCEKYTLSKFEESLRLRGEQRIHSKGILPDPYHSDQVLRDRQAYNGGSSDQDVFILKLNQNINADLKSLEVLRKYNKKCFVILVAPDLAVFEFWKNHILSKSLFNFYLMKPTNCGEMYTLYKLCPYCKLGSHHFQYDNSWEYQKGFQNVVKYTNSFKGNFFGATLKIGLKYQNPPMIFMIGISSNGRPIFAGADYWTVELLSKTLNFRMHLMENKDGTACRNNNSIFTGYCQLLIEGKVDMAGFPVAITWWGNQFFDFADVTYQAYQVLVSANPPSKPQWDAILKALTPMVSLSILLSLICVVVLYWIFLQLMGEKKQSFGDVIFVMVSILSFESTPVTGQRVTGQIIIGVWMIACFFVISGVFGEITSITAQPGLSRNPINSIQDLRKNQMSWITSPLFNTDATLRKSLSDTDLSSKSKIMKIKDGLQYILKHPLQYAYFYPKGGILPTIRVHFWTGHGPNPFYVSSNIGSPYYLAIFVAKDAPFREAVSQKILQIESSGLVRYKFIPDGTEVLSKYSKLKYKHEKIQKRYFILENLIPPGVVMGFGLTLSIVVFIVEFVSSRCKRFINTGRHTLY